MKKFFIFILGLTAIFLILTAGFYSVYGLSKLFVGASMAVIVMAGTLEFSKIVIVSFLHQFWKKINKAMRVYLIIAIFALMLITSAGIYGFLSSAYSVTSTELSQVSSLIESKQKDIDARKATKEGIDKQIETKRDRVIALTELRNTQEVRLDSLYNRGWFQSARRTEKAVEKADANIDKLSIDIQNLTDKIKTEDDSIAKIETYITQVKNEKILGEVGPLKYVASITGSKIDNVVNWLILLFIFLIDPLAILFIISASLLIKLVKEDKKIALKKENIPTKKTDAKETEIVRLTDKLDRHESLNNINVKGKPLIEYETDKNGDFKKQSAHIKIDGDEIVEGVYTAVTKSHIEKGDDKKNDIENDNLLILKEIYKNRNIGDEIRSYEEIADVLKFKQIGIETIKDFIAIISLLNIVKKDNNKLIIQKNFKDAKEIIQKV